MLPWKFLGLYTAIWCNLGDARFCTMACIVQACVWNFTDGYLESCLRELAGSLCRLEPTPANLLMELATAQVPSAWSGGYSPPCSSPLPLYPPLTNCTWFIKWLWCDKENPAIWLDLAKIVLQCQENLLKFPPPRGGAVWEQDYLPVQCQLRLCFTNFLATSSP